MNKDNEPDRVLSSKDEKLLDEMLAELTAGFGRVTQEAALKFGPKFSDPDDMPWRPVLVAMVQQAARSAALLHMGEEVFVRLCRVHLRQQQQERAEYEVLRGAGSYGQA